MMIEKIHKVLLVASLQIIDDLFLDLKRLIILASTKGAVLVKIAVRGGRMFKNLRGLSSIAKSGLILNQTCLILRETSSKHRDGVTFLSVEGPSK